MKLLELLIQIDIIIGIITIIIGILNKWFNLNEVFVFFVRLLLGIIFLMTIVLLIDIILGIITIY